MANLLVEGGVRDLDVIQAALLHDTVEDTDTTNEELVQEFGPEVAGIVAEVSAWQPSLQKIKILPHNIITQTGV